MYTSPDLNIVTCHTPECDNEGMGIELDLSIEFDGVPTRVGAVQCGPCGGVITDIVPVTP